MKFHYRITKYDPQYRDENGRYTQNEWTSFNDIGKAFGSSMLSEEEYRQVEDAYISSALSFLNESDVRKLSLIDVQNPNSLQIAGIELRDGNICEVEAAENLFRAVLREQFWCKFESQNRAYVHFGWDYYMYIAVPHSCPKSVTQSERQGLFVEPFVSPYHEGG